MKKLFILLICSSILWYCSPSKRLQYHIAQSEKILKEYPELKDNISLDSLIKKDSFKTIIKTDTVFELEKDTFFIDQSLDSLFFYKQLIDSLEEVLKNKPQNKETQKRKKEIDNKIKDKTNQLIEGSFLDQRFNVDIPITYKNKDSVYVDNLSLNLFYYKGKMNLIGFDSTDLFFDKTEYSLSVKQRITLWAWIKDEKSIFALVLILILLSIIIFKK